MTMEPESTTLSTRGSSSPSSSPGRHDLVASKIRSNISTTCGYCRSKHLKCDGLQPCSRCAGPGTKCVYLQSRRGYRGPSKGGNKSRSENRQPTSIPVIDGGVQTKQPGVDTEVGMLSTTNFDSSSMALESLPHIHSSTQFQVSNKSLGPSQTSQIFGDRFGNRCKEAFFQYFYSSHPFLPPRNVLLQMLETAPKPHLETAICFVGSQYVRGANCGSYSDKLESLLAAPNSLRDASMVQTMLLFALGLDSNNDQMKAMELLSKAEALARELGMNLQEYAYVNGLGISAYEESLRRTWWELYVVKIMWAGLHQKSIRYISDNPSNVPLPCEERDFIGGTILPLYMIEDFDNASFGNEDVNWSSYTYRIAAVRNLERILRSKELLFVDELQIDLQDAYLVNWNLHLPEGKKSYFDVHGDFDEMIFQAHMITNVSSILLHRQQSKIQSFVVQPITSCTGQPSLALGSSLETIHTIKAAQAASKITQLIALPTPLIRHTHFFICAITLASIVQLSLWSDLSLTETDSVLKQQILMDTGALGEMASVWPSANIVFNQINKVAQKIYVSRKGAVDEVEVVWRNLVNEDITWSLIEDVHSNDGS